MLEMQILGPYSRSTESETLRSLLLISPYGNFDLVKKFEYHSCTEKEMATHSTILAGTQGPGGLHSPEGCKKSQRYDLVTKQQ